MESRPTIAYVPSSHLDLFWLGNYNTTLERGAHVIKTYLDRCLQTPDETFLLETTVFADYFLKRYPEYREPLLRLIREGRVEVGAVFVDRWEHLTPGESIIRNIQMGVQWCRENLDLEPQLVTHPDLPSLLPQTSQIYVQAGIKFYVTSRKVFEHGAVWRHASPDGSKLIYLNWPRHYMYFPLSAGDLSSVTDGWHSTALDIDASLDAFPLGTIPVNGSAADLTDPETFRERYGDYLWHLVAENRERYPQFDFAYTIPSTVLEPYASVERLPERCGEIPSVWGVACDEEVAFFRRNRQLENMLLTAETVAAVASHLQLNWLPPSIDTWQGTMYESAFYARKDPIAPENALNELWEMQIFSEDHNGGGYEGALSSFQKRVIQERALEYAGQIIGTGLSSIASEIETQSPGFLVFNPLGRPWSGPVSLRIPEQMWSEGLRPTDVQGESLPVQAHRTADGEVMAHVWLDGVPSVGYQFVALEPKAGESEARATSITRTATELMLETKRWRIVIDIASGAVTSLHDLDAGADWGRADLFNICSLREAGNDVTLRMDAAAPPVRSVSVSVDVTENGPLFTRVQLTKRIHDASVIQTITVWSRSERVDVETRIRWWGERNVQIRMTLPSPDSASDIAYGTPFYGSGWTDVVLDAAPRNPDEILPSDYHAYREVQQWLHLRRSEAGLLLVTSHPGFHFGDEGPAAVLMRTSPSCGDPRLFWENPGEQVYRFSMVPTGPKWQAARPFDVADGVLRTPEAVFTDMRGTGSLPNTHSLLTLESESAVLSSLSQREGDGAIRIRVFEGTGAPTSLSVSGPLVEDARVQVVDLLDRPIQGMRPETTSFDLPPWRIQTLRVTRNPTT